MQISAFIAEIIVVDDSHADIFFDTDARPILEYR